MVYRSELSATLLTFQQKVVFFPANVLSNYYLDRINQLQIVMLFI